MTDLLEEVRRVQHEAELVHSEQAVQSAIGRLAEEITLALADSNPLVLCVMTGGLIPVGWLLPKLRFPLQLDYVHATRYRGDTKGHELERRVWPGISVRDRVVLLVDDIFDEGVTVSRIVRDCCGQGAHQVFTAVLVKKLHDRAGSNMQPDFIGLTTPDRYLFGCGLDYKNYLRNLPAIYAVSGMNTPNGTHHD
ncbi:MAG: hypoxanthine-guanine phosphoribosyltransferase [Gammaproteobacteria bacterium]